jgi:hypothetical protein
MLQSPPTRTNKLVVSGVNRVGAIHEAAVLFGGFLRIKKRRIEREVSSRLCASRQPRRHCPYSIRRRRVKQMVGLFPPPSTSLRSDASTERKPPSTVRLNSVNLVRVDGLCLSK